MDKIQFNSVLKRYTGTTQREAEEILSLKSQYPYSQLLQALAARVSKDHNFSIQADELTMAAIHAADRGVLKDVITYQPVEEVIAEPEEARVEEIKIEKVEIEEVKAETVIVKETIAPEKPKEEIISKPEAEKIIPITRTQTPQTPEKIVRYNIDSDDVAGEVMKDLQRLSKLKHNFEMLLTDYADSANKSEKVVEKKKESAEIKPDVKEVKADVNASAPQVKEEAKEKAKPVPPVRKEKKESLRERRERMVALAKAIQAENAAKEKSDEKEPSGRAKKKDLQDEIIDEITNNNEEIRPDNDKQKEQISIINHFIKTQPSISNPKERNPPLSGDLSAIKSGEFGDHIISETLVEILVKQGKKDKAIEVLKKLIWKYPQKKAYFASQIEELKK